MSASQSQLKIAGFGVPHQFSSLSSISHSELPPLISLLIDLCLQSDSRARDQRSVASYILAKWTPELESHSATYSFLSLKSSISLTTFDVSSASSPTKKKKVAPNAHQKRRQRSSEVVRRTKSGDGTAKRESGTRKSKSGKTSSGDTVKCSASIYDDSLLPDSSLKRQRIHRKSSSTTNSKRPPPFAPLAPKKSQSSSQLLQQRPSTTPTLVSSKGTPPMSLCSIVAAHRPNTAHGTRPCTKFNTLADDAHNVTNSDGYSVETTKNNNETLRRLFTAIELAKDKISLVLLCHLVNGYLCHCKTTVSRRRLRECVRLDSVGFLLRALRSMLCEPNDGAVNRLIAENILAHTIMCFSAKDRKFLLKVRLSGIMPLFVSRLLPTENANHVVHYHNHYHHQQCHSLLPLSFYAHPTSLLRLIAHCVHFQNDTEHSQLPPLGSPAAIAKYNRQTETELTLNYQKLFAELTTPAASEEDALAKDELSISGYSNSDYETNARSWAQKVKGAGHFVKLAYPNLVECPTDGAGGGIFRHFIPEANSETVNPTLTANIAANNGSNNVSSELMSAQRVTHNNTHTGHQSNFKKRIVFDLNHLADTEPPQLLDNDDLLKIGAPLGDHLLFESRFESGNLCKAIQVSPTDYELVLSPDINQYNVHFQWFFFQVSSMRSGVPYTFEIVNCAKSFSMFSKGMQPVLFSVVEAARHNNPCWSRVGSSICYFCNMRTVPNSKIDPNLQATFSPMTMTKEPPEKPSQWRRLTEDGGKTPSKAEAVDSTEAKRKEKKTASAHKKAENADGKKNFFTLRFTIQFPHDADVCYIAYHFPYTYSRLQATLECRLSSTPSARNIYMHRQRLTRTLCSNAVPLLTVTASPLDVQCRAFVLITARVHPGEANSSWIMHGIINFLLSAHPLAVRARELFVFKLIPMLNPDGVISGSQRCSLSGQDLNRVWNDPSPALHPTIYHAKGLIQYMIDLARKRPFAFVDLHGHSRKANVFMYGNNPSESWRQSDRDASSADITIPRQSFGFLPQILDEVSDSFALKDCAFSVTKSKEFSARVTTWRQFGLKRAYTMESTYCGFDQGPKAGRQIMMEDMKLVGIDLVKALVQLWDVQQQIGAE